VEECRFKHDQEHTDIERARRVSSAGRDRISLTAPAVSSTARRLVALQRRERFAGRLRPDLGKHPLQELNARRERITIGVYGVGQ